MSLDPEALKEMAANRGLKLRRSRIRNPEKRGFNRFGLVNAAGEAVFGFRRDKPAADLQEIADYLRGAEVQDWRASLKEVGAVVPRSGASEPASPPAKKKSKPDPTPEIREARKGDAEQLAALFATLDHPIDAKAVAANLKVLEKAGEPVLVMAKGKEVIGVIGIHRTTNPHRTFNIGRITVLAVTEAWRGRGTGRLLVEEAERRMTAMGCGMVEVTSADRRGEAHAFYKHLGYERTSIRFAKPLARG
ncbi:GNAT family N-acetyltransferase [Sphingomonas arenae]|uniref:GNAT family N-acetyltransferase n=1 Tax=Sphingomonas arenae TaxID=2812555 RepID=UPI00196815BA|nr:GNAT family N-acetyltransferase [Sphingomonas arenae]